MDSNVEEEIIPTTTIVNVDNISGGGGEPLKMDVCRVCFAENDTMTNLFREGASLADRLMSLANVKMTPDDGLPSQICSECVAKLDSSYRFKLQVEESENVLKQKLDSFNVKEESYFPSNKIDNEEGESGVEKSFGVEQHENEEEKKDVKLVGPSEDQEMQEINSGAEVQERDQEIQEVASEPNVENHQSFGELQEMMLDAIKNQEQIQEELNGNQHIAIQEHDYVESQLCQNFKGTKQDESKDVDEKDKVDETREEESISNESTRRSTRKQIQQNSEQRMSSDEENYFENLNLSSRLKRVQSEKLEKIFFMCYWCDKQFSSRELLREHMYSHEEVRKTLSLVSKSLDKVHKTPEKSSNVTSSSASGVSGKQANTCPHCGKEYLYLISYEKHLKQHRKEEKGLKDNSVLLEVSFQEDEESLDFPSYDDNYAVESDDENDEKKNVDESKPVQEQPTEEKVATEVKLKSLKVELTSLPKEQVSIFLKEENIDDETTVDTESEIKKSSADSNVPSSKVEPNKKFKCPHCSHAFKQRNALSLHMRIHKKIKKINRDLKQPVSSKSQSYHCKECNKKFGNELTLRNHLIATGHKTTVKGEKYDLNKRVKRVAAKAALKVIDKIKTDLSFDDSDEEKNDDKYKDADYEDVIEKISIKAEQLEYVSPKSKRTQKSPGALFCATCNLRCVSKQALAKHMEEHAKLESPIKQEKCDAEEIEDDDDYEGGIDDWPMETYECATCKKKYSTKKSLLRHQLLHEEPNFECDICNVKFYRKDKLKAHYDKCSEKNPEQVRKCNICGDMFESNEMLRDHRAAHVADGILTEEDLLDIDPKPEEQRGAEGGGGGSAPRKRRTDIVGLECKECNKRYSSRKGLLRHMQVHEGKKFLCDMCPKKFYRREHLKIHVAKHNIVKPYKCEKCSKRFIKEELLSNHMLRHERVAKKPKDSPSAGGDGSKRFLCEICSKSFTQSTTLVAHLRAHNGIKPYVCEVCSRPFTTNAYLKMHMRTHTQERPYICQYCSRAFARADTLANHLTSHTGEAKYHCKFCPKHFRRLKSLKEHVFIHTGQRPYACPTCDRKFNNNGSRYAHSKRCKQQLLKEDEGGQQVMSDDVRHLLDTRILLTSSAEDEQDDEQDEHMQLVEHHHQEGASLQLVEQGDLQEAQQHQVVQRIGMVTTSAGQFIKPQNIKTITIARPVDATLAQQRVMGQEILMPLILPFAVTYGDSEEVILSDNPKIFTS